jgi:hypothetical protein
MPSRNAIGITALVVAALGGLLQCFGSGALGAEGGANGLKMGLIFGLLWLAYDDLIRLPKWLLPALAVVVFAMLKFKWLLLAVPVVAAVGWLLYPRSRQRPGQKASGRKSRGGAGRNRARQPDDVDTAGRTKQR